jgi:DNA-directed RNA polymerase subunit M/transcription elongation factor TFIIS
MKYCPVCENILYPKEDNQLYCKACKKIYSLSESEKEEYENFKVLKTESPTEAPVVEKDLTEKINDEDRKAHEDYFGTTNENT